MDHAFGFESLKGHHQTQDHLDFLLLSSKGISFVVQWLKLHNPKAEGLGSIPGQGTKSHIPQLTVSPSPSLVAHIGKNWPAKWETWV